MKALLLLAACAEPLAPFDHQMTTAARLSAEITDGDGQPIQGAVALVRAESSDGLVEVLGRGISDDSGAVSVRLSIPDELLSDLQIKVFHSDHGFTTLSDSAVSAWLSDTADTVKVSL